MSEPKFTPGPWKQDYPNSVISLDGKQIAITYNSPCDARLIAAAPDLLDAAKYAMECLERLNTELGQIGDNGDQAYNALKAAFEKAITN